MVIPIIIEVKDPLLTHLQQQKPDLTLSQFQQQLEKLCEDWVNNNHKQIVKNLN